VDSPSARQRLLDAAVDHVTEHGLSDLSLRTLAAELGTSHRMLIHHFGSKDGLWSAIVDEVERRQQAMLVSSEDATADSLEDGLLRWWEHISDPSMWPSERLFFEVYGRALQGHGDPSLLERSVTPWVEPAARQAEQLGVPTEDAEALARLGVAITRGLLLDLLATGDREGVDRAMALWARLASSTTEPPR
jgi:AcrR family transcriptional regulator